MESDLEAVARAYRAVRETGAKDLPAFRAALAAYCAVHPGAAADLGTARRVALLIYEACTRGMLWPVSQRKQ
jgi:hypothetical protein